MRGGIELRLNAPSHFVKNSYGLEYIPQLNADVHRAREHRTVDVA